MGKIKDFISAFFISETDTEIPTEDKLTKAEKEELNKIRNLSNASDIEKRFIDVPKHNINAKKAAQKAAEKVKNGRLELDKEEKIKE